MRKFLIIAVLAGVTCALTGCGPDSAGSTNSAGSGGGGGSKTAKCDLAAPSLIKDTLGLDVGAPSASDNGGSVLVCTYPPASGATKTVLVRFDTGSDAAQFKTARDSYATQNLTTTDYPGFADQAYTSTISAIGITTNTLVARKGKVELPVSSSASFDHEKALEQKLFDALA
jgi:hypothetical protein